MAHKQVHFCSEAREKILRGATALADAVRTTLGPKSISKVVRVALENVVSVASVLLLTEATLAEVPETKERRGISAEPGME
jgi:chaperonin GroEL (HSP60 family)